MNSFDTSFPFVNLFRKQLLICLTSFMVLVVHNALAMFLLGHVHCCIRKRKNATLFSIWWCQANLSTIDFLPGFSKLMQSFDLEDSYNLKAFCIKISCGDFSFQKLKIDPNCFYHLWYSMPGKGTLWDHDHLKFKVAQNWLFLLIFISFEHLYAQFESEVLSSWKLLNFHLNQVLK